MEFYDVYQTDVFPHILYFDSWEHAVDVVERAHFERVSNDMCFHNVKEFHRIRDLWRSTFEQMATNHRKLKVSGLRQNEGISMDVNAALIQQYKLEPLSFATNNKIAEFFSTFRRNGLLD